jgi:hypothetical protein
MNSFTEAIFELIEKIDQHNQTLDLKKKAIFYLAGGVAVHFYTNMRVSDDIDIIMEPYSPPIPEYLEALWSDENDEMQTLSFDYTYNPTFGLLHENFDVRAIPVKTIGNIEINVLHPIDLVITKLARFAENDENDIRELVKLDAFKLNEFEELANDALNVTPHIQDSVRYHIEWVKDMYEEERS